VTILATVILLGVLIFIHELGHFLAAKAVDIRVERFSIGLGPRLLGFTRGETEYVLSWIPLGGYVKMGGMDDEVMEAVEGGAAPASGEPGAPAARHQPGPRDFDAKPIWARVFVISAGVILNFLFAFVVYASIGGVIGSPEIDTLRIGLVENVDLPAGTEGLAELPVGANLVGVGSISIESWTDIAAAFEEVGPGAAVVRTENPSAQVTVEMPSDSQARRALAGAIPVWMPAEIGLVNTGSPASRGGLDAGDRITAVEGVAIESWWDFVREVRARPDLETELTVEREGGTLVRTVIPERTEETNPTTGETEVFGLVGIGAPVQTIPLRYERLGFVDAIVYGWDETVRVTSLILGFLRDLVTGNAPASSVGSIGAIAEMSGAAAREGLVTFLDFMALFSINLAVLNLLPIPILDGGHLMFLLVEAVRGRALSVQQRMRLSQVGLVIVLGIMVFALSNDFRRFFGI